MSLSALTSLVNCVCDSEFRNRDLVTLMKRIHPEFQQVTVDQMMK